MRLHGLALSCFALVSAVLLPTPAAACWDGVSVASERVEFSLSDEDASWSESDAKDYANWLVRIEALLPPGTKAGYQFGTTYTEGPDDGPCDVTFDQVDAAYDFESMFYVIAEACKVQKPEDRKSTRLNSSHVRISY